MDGANSSLRLLERRRRGYSRRARSRAGRMRRIGALMGFNENDPDGNLRYSALTQALADLGWTEGRNVRMDLRWGLDNTGFERSRRS